MLKEVKQKLLKFDYKNKINSIIELSKKYPKSKFEFKGPCNSLIPFYLGLHEIGLLFFDIEQYVSKNRLVQLFTSNNSTPNLYERLKCSRDLFRSCQFIIEFRAINDDQTAAKNDANQSNTYLGEAFWIDVFNSNRIKHSFDKVEIARIIDDVLESILGIVDQFDLATGSVKEGGWREILRELNHVIDHFDYTENLIIDSILESIL